MITNTVMLKLLSLEHELSSQCQRNKKASLSHPSSPLIIKNKINLQVDSHFKIRSDDQ